MAAGALGTSLSISFNGVNVSDAVAVGEVGQSYELIETTPFSSSEPTKRRFQQGFQEVYDVTVDTLGNFIGGLGDEGALTVGSSTDNAVVMSQRTVADPTDLTKYRTTFKCGIEYDS